MSAFSVRTLGDLDDAVTLAPERLCAADASDGTLLSSLVIERTERLDVPALEGAVVFDTTHAKDGLLDPRPPLRSSEAPSSAKKVIRPGDLLVSRLRPYLRQIALVHPAVEAECAGRPMACSTEFYVLSPRTPESLAFLLPWLLSDPIQTRLAAAQEGGHHPRVPREVLLSLRVEPPRVKSRTRVSPRVESALAAVYAATHALERALR